MSGIRQQEEENFGMSVSAIGKKSFLKLISLKLLFIDEKHKKADGTEVEPLLKWFL